MTIPITIRYPDDILEIYPKPGKPKQYGQYDEYPLVEVYPRIPKNVNNTMIILILDVKKKRRMKIKGKSRNQNYPEYTMTQPLPTTTPKGSINQPIMTVGRIHQAALYKYQSNYHQRMRKERLILITFIKQFHPDTNDNKDL